MINKEKSVRNPKIIRTNNGDNIKIDISFKMFAWYVDVGTELFSIYSVGRSQCPSPIVLPSDFRKFLE
jgi:hypothetical protein